MLVLVTETPIYRGAELFAGQVFCFPESGLREGRTSVRLGFWERQLLSWQVFQNQKMVSHRVRREHGENTEIRPGNANFQVGKSFKTKRWFRTEYAESTERTQRYALGTPTFKLAGLEKRGCTEGTERTMSPYRTEVRGFQQRKTDNLATLKCGVPSPQKPAISPLPLLRREATLGNTLCVRLGCFHFEKASDFLVAHFRDPMLASADDGVGELFLFL